MQKIGLYGLGRMGGNMARRLSRGGIRVLALNRTFDVARKLAEEEANVSACADLDALVAGLPAPRIVWLMLPAGAATDDALDALAERLAPGDLVVDGATGHYKEAERRAVSLADKGIGFADVGVSGGIWGLANGYCLMAGAEPAAMARVEPFLKVLAPSPEHGWLHTGPVGSGHFTKMVHNGIEYGLMQAYAEGFDILNNAGIESLPADQRYTFPLADIAELWRRGSVVSSWLLDLSADALARDPELSDFSGFVQDSGEGRWTAAEAIERGVPTPVMSMALMMRFASQGKADYASRLLAMMRKGFGGHAVKEE